MKEISLREMIAILAIVLVIRSLAPVNLVLPVRYFQRLRLLKNQHQLLKDLLQKQLLLGEIWKLLVCQVGLIG
uniref:Uncharacterized protein n=1 Tax=Panstrongylus lignarius TaxID=156445 RepID=A0A224XTX5_9HEMI